VKLLLSTCEGGDVKKPSSEWQKGEKAGGRNDAALLTYLKYFEEKGEGEGETECSLFVGLSLRNYEVGQSAKHILVSMLRKVEVSQGSFFGGSKSL